MFNNRHPSALDEYQTAFAVSSLTIAHFTAGAEAASAGAEVFTLIGVTLGIASLPVLAVGLGIAVFASGTLKEQADAIPSVLAPLTSPFMFITLPLSPLISPQNAPLLAANVITPILEIGSGLSERDALQVPTSVLEADGWQRDTQKYYDAFLKPEISNLATSISNFLQSFAQSSSPANTVD